MAACQDRNSSAVSVYRLQASSRDSKPPRTAATTWALRRMTQRFVSGEGKSAIVNGLPSGPIAYLEPRPSDSLIIRYGEDEKTALISFAQFGWKFVAGAYRNCERSGACASGGVPACT